MEAIARVELYDYQWDNDYPDVLACPVRLTCYQINKKDLTVPVLSFPQIGHRLDHLMQAVKTQIAHRSSWFWQHRFVAGWLITLSHQSTTAGIQLVPTYQGEDYPQAPEDSSLWRILVCWDRDLAADGYFYAFNCYRLTPDQRGDHIERLEPVEWEKAREKETR